MLVNSWIIAGLKCERSTTAGQVGGGEGVLSCKGKVCLQRYLEGSLTVADHRGSFSDPNKGCCLLVSCAFSIQYTGRQKAGVLLCYIQNACHFPSWDPRYTTLLSISTKKELGFGHNRNCQTLLRV
ncbi:Hypothetical predicted protein [Pelobates cultripes]|uniref:Uncharacterized protein n=1 Tax=Pelobates cultripes TaxID=61616 RepID=A0AAD1SJA6_PELCU|nr:Hypothetical predicted protein [Pelobates cultripes]